MQRDVRGVRPGVDACAYALVLAFRVKLLVARALRGSEKLNVAEIHPFFPLLSEKGARTP